MAIPPVGGSWVLTHPTAHAAARSRNARTGPYDRCSAACVIWFETKGSPGSATRDVERAEIFLVDRQRLGRDHVLAGVEDVSRFAAQMRADDIHRRRHAELLHREEKIH